MKKGVCEFYSIYYDNRLLKQPRNVEIYTANKNMRRTLKETRFFQCCVYDNYGVTVNLFC